MNKWFDTFRANWISRDSCQAFCDEIDVGTYVGFVFQGFEELHVLRTWHEWEKCIIHGSWISSLAKEKWTNCKDRFSDPQTVGWGTLNNYRFFFQYIILLRKKRLPILLLLLLLLIFLFYCYCLFSGLVIQSFTSCILVRLAITMKEFGIIQLPKVIYLSVHSPTFFATDDTVCRCRILTSAWTFFAAHVAPERLVDHLGIWETTHMTFCLIWEFYREFHVTLWGGNAAWNKSLRGELGLVLENNP